MTNRFQMSLLVGIIIAAGLIGQAHAQTFNGHTVDSAQLASAVSLAQQRDLARFRSGQTGVLTASGELALPELKRGSLEQLQAENRAIAADSDGTLKPKALRSGFARWLQPSFAKAGGEIVIPQRVVAKSAAQTQAVVLSIKSPGAAGVRAAVVLASLPPQTQIRVRAASSEGQAFAANHSSGFGPFLVSDLLADQPIFWTPFTLGEVQEIELTLQDGGSMSAAKTIELSDGINWLASVSHEVLSAASGAREVELIAKGIGDSGLCEVDINCVSNPSIALLNARASVAKMGFIKDGTSYICSGALAADNDPDTSRMFFLSANHCFDRQVISSTGTVIAQNLTNSEMQVVASTLNTFFNFESIQCNSLTPTTVQQLTRGADLRARAVPFDVILLELRDAALPGMYFAGLTNAEIEFVPVTAIHHPSGDFKMISTGAVTGNYFGRIVSSATPETFKRVRFSSGVTEGGSSGSPIFTYTGDTPFIRGTLFGGASSCSNRAGEDIYSNLHAYFPSFAALMQDTTPDVFSLGADRIARANQAIEFPAVVVTGITTTVNAEIEGATVAINCQGNPISGSFIVNAGTRLCVGQMSGAANGARTKATLTIGTRKASATTTVCDLDPRLDSDQDGIPNCEEYAGATNPATQDNRVLDSDRLFVRQSFRDWLGREASEVDTAEYLRVFSGAANRGKVVAALTGTSEFQVTAMPVLRLYYATFLREADLSGLRFWLGELRAGRRDLRNISEAFASSQELVTRYGQLSTKDYVRQLYLNILQREPDAAGVVFWEGQINGGQTTRGALLAQFAESTEFRSRFDNRALAASFYYFMLNRAPDKAGLDWLEGEFKAGRQTPVEVGGSFSNTVEYRARFY